MTTWKKGGKEWGVRGDKKVRGKVEKQEVSLFSDMVITLALA